jgi:hypothetical protein
MTSGDHEEDFNLTLGDEDLLVNTKSLPSFL